MILKIVWWYVYKIYDMYNDDWVIFFVYSDDNDVWWYVYKIYDDNIW